MAPRRWTTEAELDWLIAQRPLYLEHQKERKLHAFWPTLYHEWFQLFPEHPKIFSADVDEGNLTPEQKEVRTKAIGSRRKKLREWFANNKGDKVRASAAGTTLLHAMSATAKASRTRHPQAVELYSKKYYRERIQPHVKEEMLLAGRRLTKAEILDIVKRCTRVVYDQESDDVKAEIAAELESMKTEPVEPESSTRTPKQYQQALNGMPVAIESFLRELSRQTGWTFTVIGGGVWPEENGAIRTLSFHVGATEIGTTFPESIKDFHSTYIEPYNSYVKVAFPESVRTSRALNSSGHSSAAVLAAVSEVGGTQTGREVTMPSGQASVRSVPLAAPQLSDLTAQGGNNTINGHDIPDIDSFLAELEAEHFPQLPNFHLPPMPTNIPGDNPLFQLSNPSAPVPSSLYTFDNADRALGEESRTMVELPRLPDHIFECGSRGLTANDVAPESANGESVGVANGVTLPEIAPSSADSDTPSSASATSAIGSSEVQAVIPTDVTPHSTDTRSAFPPLGCVTSDSSSRQGEPSAAQLTTTPHDEPSAAPPTLPELRPDSLMPQASSVSGEGEPSAAHLTTVPHDEPSAAPPTLPEPQPDSSMPSESVSGAKVRRKRNHPDIMRSDRPRREIIRPRSKEAPQDPERPKKVTASNKGSRSNAQPRARYATIDFFRRVITQICRPGVTEIVGSSV
ncbi:hypothetical protein A0H81_02193 [Grifola frondosa]|uniref:Uncharacterized protein n=1 Tax=Grifola frondosa TaxID=5627 RepID=A0A1C7MLJ5_GRIFR|nr:hypothetical protein A0H81_02193 [Grifola frondosa]